MVLADVVGDRGACFDDPDPALAYLDTLQEPAGLVHTLVAYACGTRSSCRGVLSDVPAVMVGTGRLDSTAVDCVCLVELTTNLKKA